MVEKYHRKFRRFLENNMHVPDNRDGSDIEASILSYDTDLDDVETIVSEIVSISVSSDEEEFLRSYVSAIDSNMEWAQQLDSTQVVPNKKNEYSMLLSLTRQLTADLETAVNEGNELEDIARRLKDAHLLAEVEYEEEQMMQAGRNLEGILERRKKLNSLMNELQTLEQYVNTHQITASLRHRKQVLGLILNNAQASSQRSRSGAIKVSVPEDFLEQMQEFARNYQEEVCGHLICRKEGDELIALKMLLSGAGTEGNVSPDKAYVNAVNDLLEEYPRYSFIDFHTHSVGTIQQHGPQFAENWSRRDLQNFDDQGEGYTGMLATPRKILVERNGRDAELQSFNKDSSSQFREWSQTLDEHWTDIASEYSFPTSFDLTPAN